MLTFDSIFLLPKEYYDNRVVICSPMNAHEGGFGAVQASHHMNSIVTLEDPIKKQPHQCPPVEFGCVLHVKCLCGEPIWAIQGAWCIRCGARVIEIQNT